WIHNIQISPIEENKNLLEPLLQNLKNKYQNWTEHQQAAIQESINDIISILLIIQNPQFVRTRRCPTGSSNRKSTNLTKKDPSRFELVERKIRHCTL
ncbi:23211_t:CDS:1, partial [Dentiscutata erythropus]